MRNRDVMARDLKGLWVAVPLGGRRNHAWHLESGTLAYPLKPVMKRRRGSLLWGSKLKSMPVVDSFKMKLRDRGTGEPVPDILADLEDLTHITGYTRAAIINMMRDPAFPIYRFDGKLWFLMSTFTQWHADARRRRVVRGPGRGKPLPPDTSLPANRSRRSGRRRR
jgi:hypothetical protein